jgi:hypothetical protein
MLARLDPTGCARNQIHPGGESRRAAPRDDGLSRRIVAVRDEVKQTMLHRSGAPIQPVASVRRGEEKSRV